MLHIPTPTSDITVFFVVPLFVFERAWGVFNCLCIRLLFERIDA